MIETGFEPVNPYGLSRRSFASGLVIGRGVQQQGIRAGETVTFRLRKLVGPLEALRINLMHENGYRIPVEITPDTDDGCICRYTPGFPGLYTMLINHDQKPLFGTPVKILVDENTRSRLRALGSALSKGCTEFPCSFLLLHNGEPSDQMIDFSITGPSKAEIYGTENEDGTILATYCVSAIGDYSISVTRQGEHILESPFDVRVTELPRDWQINQCRVSFEGLDAYVDRKKRKLPITVTVDLTPALPEGAELEEGDLQFMCKEAHGRSIQVAVKQATPQHNYQMSMELDNGDCYALDVNLRGCSLPGLPKFVDFRTYGDNPSIKMYGQGLETVKAGLKTSFNIDYRQPELANYSSRELTAATKIKIVDKDGAELAHSVTWSDSRLAVVYYTAPEKSTQLAIEVCFNKCPVAQTPYSVAILPKYNVEQITASQFETPVYVNGCNRFSVDASAIDRSGHGIVSACLHQPRGRRHECVVSNRGSGQYTCSFTAVKPGEHELRLYYYNEELPMSPVKFTAVHGCDPARVKVQHLMNNVIPGKRYQFTVDTNGAGPGTVLVKLIGVNGHIEQVDNKDGTQTVSLEVTEEYRSAVISIQMNGIDVPGTPIVLTGQHVCDPSKVCVIQVTENAKLFQPVYFTIDASTSGPGLLEAFFINNAHRLPLPLYPIGQETGIYEVSFIPRTIDPNTQLLVTLDGTPVADSPRTVAIMPRQASLDVNIYGVGVTGPTLAGQPVNFTIDFGENFSLEHFSLTVTDPVDVQLPLTEVARSVVSKKHNRTYITYSYKPFLAGNHVVEARVDKHVLQPFQVQVEAVPGADQCRLMSMVERSCKQGESISIRVEGVPHSMRPMLRVMHETKLCMLECDADEVSAKETLLTFRPFKPGHLVGEIRLGGRLLPNGEFSMLVEGSQSLHPITFKLPLADSSTMQELELLCATNGSATVSYQPLQLGYHELHMTNNDEPMPGSPYGIEVRDSSAKPWCYGPGLSHCYAGEQTEFTIVHKKEATGLFDFNITGPTTLVALVRSNGVDSTIVSYKPPVPGEYQVAVTLRGRPIPGSPFSVHVENKAWTHDIFINGEVASIQQLTATVTTPSMKTIACKLHRVSGQRIVCNFSPEEVGDYLVNVLHDQKPIENSPFTIRVKKNDIGDAAKVRVSGKGLFHGLVDRPNTIVVDARKAGSAGLNLVIEGPSKVAISSTEDMGCCVYAYRTYEPGQYFAHITYGHQPVKGSPFPIQIEGNSVVPKSVKSYEMTQTITEDGLERNNRVKFFLPYAFSDAAHVEILSPSGLLVPCSVHTRKRELLEVYFRPHEVGVYRVVVVDTNAPGGQNWLGEHVLEDAKECASRVTVSGRDLMVGKIGVKNQFTVNTSEAGTGELSIKVSGPRQVATEFHDNEDGTCTISYTVQQPGDYWWSILFRGEHVQGSPIRTHVPYPETEETTNEAEFVITSNAHQHYCTLGQCVLLQLAGREKRDLVLVTPSGSRRQLRVEHSSDQLHTRFQLTDAGQYSVFVFERYEEKREWTSMLRTQLMDAFRIEVAGKLADKPEAIRIEGQGLHEGLVGVPNTFVVSNVPDGTLVDVNIDGDHPSEVIYDREGHEFRFRYMVAGPGVYSISITYGLAQTQHFPGSPFQVTVTGDPVPHALLEKFAANLRVQDESDSFEYRRFTYTPTQHSDLRQPLRRPLTPARQWIGSGYRRTPESRADFIS